MINGNQIFKKLIEYGLFLTFLWYTTNWAAGMNVIDLAKKVQDDFDRGVVLSDYVVVSYQNLSAWFKRTLDAQRSGEEAASESSVSTVSTSTASDLLPSVSAPERVPSVTQSGGIGAWHEPAQCDVRPGRTDWSDDEFLSRFTFDDVHGIATHRESGVQILRCPVGMLWKNGTCDTTTRPWFGILYNALLLANKADFGGHQDWRVPRRYEVDLLGSRACSSVLDPRLVYPWFEYLPNESVQVGAGEFQVKGVMRGLPMVGFRSYRNGFHEFQPGNPSISLHRALYLVRGGGMVGDHR